MPKRTPPGPLRGLVPLCRRGSGYKLAARMATIFRKTDKGHAEIATRAHKLPPRLRSALILVDGRRSDEELSRLVLAEPQATLQALLDQGFVEVISVTVERAAVPATAPPQAAPAPVPAAADAPRDFAQQRREAVRALTDAVGPMGEALALKMERAASPAELRPLLALAVQVIGNARGAGQAGQFGARFLPPG